MSTIFLCKYGGAGEVKEHANIEKEAINRHSKTDSSCARKEDLWSLSFPARFLLHWSGLGIFYDPLETQWSQFL